MEDRTRQSNIHLIKVLKRCELGRDNIQRDNSKNCPKLIGDMNPIQEDQEIPSKVNVLKTQTYSHADTTRHQREREIVNKCSQSIRNGNCTIRYLLHKMRSQVTVK